MSFGLDGRFWQKIAGGRSAMYLFLTTMFRSLLDPSFAAVAKDARPCRRFGCLSFATAYHFLTPLQNALVKDIMTTPVYTAQANGSTVSGGCLRSDMVNLEFPSSA
jgi:hypothetical protein